MAPCADLGGRLSSASRAAQKWVQNDLTHAVPHQSVNSVASLGACPQQGPSTPGERHVRLNTAHKLGPFFLVEEGISFHIVSDIAKGLNMWIYHVLSGRMARHRLALRVGAMCALWASFGCSLIQQVTLLANQQAAMHAAVHLSELCTARGDPQ